jgi:hypothetical protein
MHRRKLVLFTLYPYLVRMYIDVVPNRSSPPAVLLRESSREDGKIRKRTLANLSALPPEAIEVLRRALKGETLFSAEESVHVERSLPYGHVAAVLGTVRRLKLDQMLGTKRTPERDRVLAMIVARVLAPDSKLATARGLGEESGRGLQEPVTGGAGLPVHQDRPRRPPASPPHRTAGPGAHLPLHARLLRRVAPAPLARATPLPGP